MKRQTILLILIASLMIFETVALSGCAGGSRGTGVLFNRSSGSALDDDDDDDDDDSGHHRMRWR